MEGDPLHADRGHDDRRPRGRRHPGLYLHPLGISHAFRTLNAPSPRRARRPAGRQRARLRPRLRPRGAAGRRRLYLRRGDLAAGMPEGKRGQVRAKPPLPAIKGLFGQPTVINNVHDARERAGDLRRRREAYADYGIGRSRGTRRSSSPATSSDGGLVEFASA